MRRLVFYPILSFVTCAVLSSAELLLEVSDESLTLSIDLAVEGYQHYRIDGSTDLSQWDAIASINLSDGLGDLEVFPAVGEQLPEQMFYRVQEDDSASNVLDLPEMLHDYESINLAEHLATVRNSRRIIHPKIIRLRMKGPRWGVCCFTIKKTLRELYGLLCLLPSTATWF